MSVGRSLGSVDRSRLHVCSVDQRRPDSRLMSVGRSLGSADRSRLHVCSVDQRRRIVGLCLWVDLWVVLIVVVYMSVV